MAQAVSVQVCPILKIRSDHAPTQESIWGAPFEDEFSPQAKHDRPYSASFRSLLSFLDSHHFQALSMANAGPKSNGM